MLHASAVRMSRAIRERRISVVLGKPNTGEQVVAAAWRDDIALAMALHIERELDGYQPPPQLAVLQQSEVQVGR